MYFRAVELLFILFLVGGSVSIFLISKKEEFMEVLEEEDIRDVYLKWIMICIWAYMFVIVVSKILM